jgi:hypothetical protein
MRRFSQTTVYSTMNLDDLFVQMQVKPHSALTLRVDLHRLTLPSAADRWYSGSGATVRTGSNFGYAGRTANGATDLGTSVEFSGTYNLSRHWSINGFLASMRGGRVVTGTFDGDRLGFGYLESSLRFDLPWQR